MEKVGNMELYSLEEVMDEVMGKIGTPRRDAFEAKLEAYRENYMLGEAIREERQAQHLTQEQLGEKIGVKRAQISRLEKGQSISLSSFRRVFQALGFDSACIDLGTKKIALW